MAKDQSRIAQTVARLKATASGFLSGTASNSPYAEITADGKATGGYSTASATVPDFNDSAYGFGTSGDNVATKAASVRTDDPTAQAIAGATQAGAAQAVASAAFTENWLLRGTVIILGFIFVAVGLSMFRGSPVITLPKAVVPK